MKKAKEPNDQMMAMAARFILYDFTYHNSLIEPFTTFSYCVIDGFLSSWGFDRSEKATPSVW